MSSCERGEIRLEKMMYVVSSDGHIFAIFARQDIMRTKIGEIYYY